MTSNSTALRSIRAHVHGGQIIPDEQVNLPEGMEMIITYQLPEKTSATSLYEQYQSLIGADESLPLDAPSQVDHYVYGTPKT